MYDLTPFDSRMSQNFGARIFQGSSPTLLTITRQLIEIESCGKPQKIRLPRLVPSIKKIIWKFWV